MRHEEETQGNLCVQNFLFSLLLGRKFESIAILQRSDMFGTEQNFGTHFERSDSFPPSNCRDGVATIEQSQLRP